MNGWRDQRLKKSRWWLHGLPITIGFALAFGGLPFYQATVYGCHIMSHPVYEPSWYPLIFFTFVPIFGSILIATVLMIRVYLEVRSKSRQASRWRFSKRFKTKDNTGADAKPREGSWLVSALSFGRRLLSKGARHRDSTETANRGGSQNASPKGKKPTKKVSLEDQVFWQSCLYLGAFYLSWTLILIAFIVSSYPEGNSRLYPFYLTALILAPLQGFWNCVIYFRPRLVARHSRRVQSPSRPPGSSSIMTKVRQWLGSMRPSTEETNFVDPADEIAVSALRWDYGPAPSDKTSTMQDGSTGVGYHNVIDEDIPEEDVLEEEALEEEHLKQDCTDKPFC